MPLSQPDPEVVAHSGSGLLLGGTEAAYRLRPPDGRAVTLDVETQLEQLRPKKVDSWMRCRPGQASSAC